MSEQDHDEQTEAQHDEPEQDQHQSGEDGEDVDVSSGGVAVEGYETRNLPQEEREAVMNASSPDDVDDDLIKEIEEERARRLDPDNRPDNVEVDNTKRTFVPAEAKFEDSDVEQPEGVGQADVPPVGGSADEDDDDTEDAGHTAVGEAAGDPEDDTETVTSGTGDPTDEESEESEASASTTGKHRA